MNRRRFLRSAMLWLPVVFAVPTRAAVNPFARPSTVATIGKRRAIVGPDGFTYGTVSAADGHIWLDRNLGATQVATSATDTNAYGHLYQWGRYCDGHQLRNSGTTTTQSATDTPGNANYIYDHTDWRSSQNDNLWQGVSGVNNPCPAGFRLPTISELSALFTAESITNGASAFSSSLKLTLPGYRTYTDGSIGSDNVMGFLWSSGPSDTDKAHAILYYDPATVDATYTGGRAFGFPVRAIKDY